MKKYIFISIIKNMSRAITCSFYQYNNRLVYLLLCICCCCCCSQRIRTNSIYIYSCCCCHFSSLFSYIHKFIILLINNIYIYIGTDKCEWWMNEWPYGRAGCCAIIWRFFYSLILLCYKNIYTYNKINRRSAVVYLYCIWIKIKKKIHFRFLS